MATDLQLAYAAGIIDGEGCIRFYSFRQHRRLGLSWNLSLSVTNTDPRLMSWLMETLGTGKVVNKRMLGRKRPCYQWQVSARQAEAVLRAIRPYLVIKADQADIGLASRALVGRQQGRRRLSETEQAERIVLRDRMQVLKHAVREG